MIFTIEPGNNISVFPSARQAKAALTGEYEQFVNEKELAALAANWPGTRLTEIWNSLPGVTRVKKFKDRTTGANRIWQALQSRQREAITPEAITPDVTPDSAPQAAPVAQKKAKSGKQAMFPDENCILHRFPDYRRQKSRPLLWPIVFWTTRSPTFSSRSSMSSRTAAVRRIMKPRE